MPVSPLSAVGLHRGKIHYRIRPCRRSRCTGSGTGRTISAAWTGRRPTSPRRLVLGRPARPERLRRIVRIAVEAVCDRGRGGLSGARPPRGVEAVEQRAVSSISTSNSSSSRSVTTRRSPRLRTVPGGERLAVAGLNRRCRWPTQASAWAASTRTWRGCGSGTRFPSGAHQALATAVPFRRRRRTDHPRPQGADEPPGRRGDRARFRLTASGGARCHELGRRPAGR